MMMMMMMTMMKLEAVNILANVIGNYFWLANAASERNGISNCDEGVLTPEDRRYSAEL